jgi:hypothetical protein
MYVSCMVPTGITLAMFGVVQLLSPLLPLFLFINTVATVSIITTLFQQLFLTLIFLKNHLKNQEWWVIKFTSVGFVYSEMLTKKMREVAAISKDTRDAEHLTHRSFVFLNPVVLSKPQHMHLFGGHGCFKDYETPQVS